MVRPDWLNLNGLWNFRITRLGYTNLVIYRGKILVPFPVESPLSGVARPFLPWEQMWYQRQFIIPPEWRGRHVLLHFEAVDWATTVWVNGQKVGNHRGGYDRFSFDITNALKPEGEQMLTVSVTDPTEAGSEPHGKQMVDPRQPFFSASSGIWQTVWLEPVPSPYIQSLKLVPDVDRGVLEVTTSVRGADGNDDSVKAVALDGREPVGRVSGRPDGILDLPVPRARLWSPAHPFLYGLRVTLQHKGSVIDQVSSYFGMRKISIAKDKHGYPRLMLNNKRLFELGALDQGYWPDGVYSAPTDGALRYDVEMMKKLGFNLCRMHVKVESDRWYYWCDKLGLLVWQDMPNGDRPASPEQPEIHRTPASAKEFEKELHRMIVDRGNHPCIVIWIAFNQGWGQYDTARIVKLIKTWDPSRLVIGASGWYDMGVGDVFSLHQYPGPEKPGFDGTRACVEGECGGLGLGVPGHLWCPMGYANITLFHKPQQLMAGYKNLMAKVQQFAETNGLSGAVVTQLSDVETEDDGFMTYDRAVLKMPVKEVRAINQRVIRAGSAAEAQ